MTHQADPSKIRPGSLKITNATGSPHDTRFEVLGEDGTWHRLGHVQAVEFLQFADGLPVVTLRILCPLLDLTACPPHVSWTRNER